MAFPQQSDPQIIHLFVNDFDTLVVDTAAVNNFYSFCQDNCINFLSLYDIQAVLPGDSTELANFINLGKTTYGICDFAGSLDLFDETTNGLERWQLIDNYNTANPTNKINWITLENEFWNLDNVAFSTYSNCCTNAANSTTVTLSNSITTASQFIDVSNVISINGYWRQIVQTPTPTTFIVDRPIPVALTNVSCDVYNSGPSYLLDFDTFLHRIKLLRTYTQPRGIKLEAYLARQLTSREWKQISTVLDRVLIESDTNAYQYCIYNNGASNSVRQSLANCVQNKTGTISILNGTNVINGTGTDFLNDLAIGTKIISNGQIFTISTITLGSPQQATTLELATSTITNATYRPYIDFAPIFYVNYPLRQDWLTTPINSKSYVDVYRFFTVNGYTAGGSSQTGSAPICYNVETNVNITGSTNLVGLSIFARTYAQTIDSEVLDSQIPCPACTTSVAFQISISGSNPTCDNALNGSIQTYFNPTNTTPPYTYTYTSGSTTIQVVDSNNTYTFGGLASGTWTVTVTDSTSNVSTPQTITLVETFNPTISTVGNTINFHLTGGTPTYYISSWPYGTFFETGLSNGTYSYTATNGTYNFIIGDSDSCVTDPIPVTVDNTATIAINASSTNPTCTAAADGTITVNINSSATPPYTYAYSRSGSPTIYQVSNSITNTYSSAIPGTWSVTVSDSNGDFSNTVVLTLTATFAPTVTTASNQVTFNLVGGTPPYSIVGNTSPQFNRTGLPSGVNTFNGLPSGSFIFTVTDENGCTTNLPVTIAGGSILTLNISSYVRPNCDATANGIVNLSPGGGLPPYVSYSATNGTTTYTNTTGTFTGLTSDSWTFSLRDSTGTIATNTLALLDLFNVRYTNTGTTICISASGGSLGNYTVILNGQQLSYNTATTVNCYTGICGTNNITVIDGNLSLSGCVYTATTYVVCPLGISISATPNTCFNFTSDGSVIITASGGTPPYNYQITNPAVSPLNNGTGIFTNLPPGIGNWTALVTDNNGLITNGSFSLRKNYSWGVYAAYTGFCVTISGGTSPYEITINGPLEQTTGIFVKYTASTQGIYCFPANPGRYGIQLYDANFCSSDARNRVFTYAGAVGLNVLETSNTLCNNSIGKILVEGIGGNGDYTYSATNGTTLYTNNYGYFGGLSAGTWTLYVTDSLGLLGTDSVTLYNEGISAITSIVYSSYSICTYIPPYPPTYRFNINGGGFVYSSNTQICSSIPYCNNNPSVSVCLSPQSVFDLLYSFDSANGYPTITSELVLGDDDKFYGLTNLGSTLYSFDLLGNYNIVATGIGGPTQDPTFLLKHSNGKLYGTTAGYGGTIFSCDTTNGSLGYLGTADTLIEGNNGVLYGTTEIGGLYNFGTIFSCTTSGAYGVIHNFDGTNGKYPNAIVEYSNGLLYGSTLEGSTINSSYSTIFSCSTSGNFGVVYNFDNTVVFPVGFFYNVNFNRLYKASNNKIYGTIYVQDFDGTQLYSFNPNTNTLQWINTPDLNVQTNFLEINNSLYCVNTIWGGYSTALYPIRINLSSDSVIPTNISFAPPFNTNPTYIGSLFGLTLGPDNYVYTVNQGGGINGTGSILRAPIEFSANCCYATTIPGSQIDADVYGTYLSGDPYVCISINENNSIPSPYQVYINNQLYVYDTNQNTNCFQVTACTTTNVQVCNDNRTYNTQYQFDNAGNLFDGIGRTPYGTLTEGGDGKLYGVTFFGFYYGSNFFGTVFSADSSGSNIGIIYEFDGSFGSNPYEGVTYHNGMLFGTTEGTYGVPSLFAIELSASPVNVYYSLLSGNPYAKPIIANNGKLYGVIRNGGNSGVGAIYSAEASTTLTFGLIHHFNGTDGSTPYATLLSASDGKLYGTTYVGGTSNLGVIFSYDISTNQYNVIHNFSGGLDGQYGIDSLIEGDNGILYGIAESGGLYNNGLIYEYNLNTNSYQVLYNFSGGTSVADNNGALLKSTDGFLYGMSTSGGDYGFGCIFRFNPNDGTFEKIHDFLNDTTDGGQPYGSLIEASNGLIFGLTSTGGINGGGTMFSLDVDYCCPINQTISLSSGFTAPDVNLVWISGNPQVCISIDPSTFAPPPYEITISGNTYDYNLSLSANCYPISGCGNINISIQNFSVDDDNYSTITYFTGGTNTGRNPYSSLIQASNGLLYGMTYLSQGSGFGTIFSANTSGQKGEIHVFNSTQGSSPRGALIQGSNGILYGLTTGGGTNSSGTFFSCSTSGNHGVLDNFGLFPEPTVPYGSLIEVGNGKFYGTTVTGGLTNDGTIFSCDTSGNIGTIHSFSITDGSAPHSTLLYASNGLLYGTTLQGGTNSDGVIFSCRTNGNFGVIHHFDSNTNDGASPYGKLIENNNGYLYGMTNQGGTGAGGTIFKINKNGTDYSIVHNFGTIPNDGTQPYGSLFKASTGNIYGMTYFGGILNYGVIFKLDSYDNYSIIHEFSGSTYLDGGNPYYTSLIEGTDGNLYGTTASQGIGSDNGTIFKLGVTLTSGCTYNTTLNVSCDEPLDLNITATVLPCLSNNGSVSVLATGGYPIYTYTLTNGITTFTQTGNTGSVRTFSNLTADTYTATVTDISGNTDSITLQLSYIDAGLTVSGQDLCISVTGSNVTNHLVYVNNILQYTSPAAITFSTCLTGLTGCGVSQILRIVDSDTGCFYQTSFIIPCVPFNVVTTTTNNPWCYNQPAVVRVSVTGGSQPYDFELIQSSPSISAITPFSVTYGTTPPLYNYATFLVNPPYGTWFGQITDNNGTVITTNNVTLQPRFYVVDPVFSTTGVTLTFSGATPNLSNSGGWTNVSINGTPYNQLTDGTYTYPLPCGVNNTILVQGIDGIKPYAQCLYIFTSYTPCDLGGYNTFVRPECLGDPVSLLAVFITGGTPNYNVSITNGITTYTGVTSDNDIVFQSTGPYPINITGGTWTITTTDSSLDTFIQTITVTPSFNAFVPTISSTGATITISGGTPLYNVTIDGTNYGNTFTNSTYSFPLSPGSHTAVITQPFGDALCPITLSFNIPFDDIVCDYTYSNPTCNNNIGSIAISVTGGTGLYTYTITDGLNTYSSVPPLSAYPNYIFNNLGAGNWQVNVVDSNGSSCNNTITLASNFNVTATGVTSSSSYSSGNICIQINGGTPPYNVYIDNVIRLSATTNLNVCLSASSNANHTYLVVDSNPPCTIYVNDPIFQNSNFDTNTNWLLSYVTGCNNPAVNPIACCTQQYFEINNSNLLYTGLTPASLAFNANGCVQIASARQNFVWPYGARPVASTYAWEIKTGLVSGISPGYAAFQLFVPWLTNSINPVPPYGTGAPPFPGLQSYRTYGGTLYVPSNVYNVNPAVYSGYGINLIISGGYSASTAGQGCKIQISATQLTLISYDISCPCTASGTTFVPGLAGPTISLVGFTNPNCEAASDGVITVSASGGIPGYIYSATNGTTTYTSVNGIFNGLNAGTWYLSLVDSLGATSTLAQPITLYDTFYADVNSYSNGYCVTITGGTQPYIVAIDSNPLNWDYNFDTNCYSANCNTTSVITVRDSS